MFSIDATDESSTPCASGDATRPRHWDAETPNPFSLARGPSESALTHRLWRGLKTTAAILLVTGVLLGGVFLGKQWLLHRLVAGLDDLDIAAKQNRLIQIASFGTAAIEPLVDRLVDDHDEVSESAFVLLQQMQNDWVTLEQDDAIAAHERLVTAIAISYGIQKGDQKAPKNLTSQQIARGRELLNQTILEFAALDHDQSHSEVQRAAEHPSSRSLVESANELLDRMRFPDVAPSPSLMATASRGVASDNGSGLDERSGWTDWPPPNQDQSVRSWPAQIVRSGEKTASADAAEQEAGRLRAVPPGVTVALSQIVSPSRPTKVLAARRPVEPPQDGGVVRPSGSGQVGETFQSGASVVQMTTHLAHSPMTVLDDETVIRHLANPDALIAEQAKSELVARGFTPAQMEMAQAIAVASPPDRIRLIDSLVHSSQLDSGPWLSMMLDDPDRSVRLHVVSTLAATLANRNDPGLVQRLRRRLSREQDAHVAKRLRNVLDLR